MQNVQAVLTDMYPWKKFDFGSNIGSEEWGYRYLISCILVGASRETATIKCGQTLFAKYPDMNDLANANVEEIAVIIQASGVRFHGPKAKNVCGTSNIILKHYNGRVPDERHKLEKLPGVGRHVASVILATVYDQEEFAVDVHVRRIAKRFGVRGNTDLEIENEIRAEIPAGKWGHFSRAFVDFGQQRCAKTPNCNGCPLKSACSYTSETVKPKSVVKTKSTLDVNEYTIEERDGKTIFTKHGVSTSVTVSNGRCSCKGFRFRRTCKHSQFV